MKSSCTLCLDSPKQYLLEEEDVPLNGWFGWKKGQKRSFELRTVSGPLRTRIYERPDVKNVFTDLDVIGFASIVSLRHHIQAVRQETLTIYAISSGTVVGVFRFGVKPQSLARAIQRFNEY